MGKDTQVVWNEQQLLWKKNCCIHNQFIKTRSYLSKTFGRYLLFSCHMRQTKYHLQWSTLHTNNLNTYCTNISPLNSSDTHFVPLLFYGSQSSKSIGISGQCILLPCLLVKWPFKTSLCLLSQCKASSLTLYEQPRVGWINQVVKISVVLFHQIFHPLMT